MGSLIVGILGDFTQWRAAMYIVGESGDTFSARMSTVALYEHLRASGGYHRVLLIAPESLAAINRWVRDGQEWRAADEALMIPDPVDTLGSKVRGRAILCNEYKYFLADLEKALVKSVEILSEGRLGSRNMKLSVAPAVGSYGYSSRSGYQQRREATWRLKGAGGVNPFSLFASSVLLAIIEAMVGLEVPCGKLDVHVDLTHGVNYTQTALYRAALAAARLYSLSRRVIVQLHIYNSDPYPRGIPGTHKLRLWKIRSEIVTPPLAASRAFYMVARGWKRSPFHPSPQVTEENAPEACKKAVEDFNSGLRVFLLEDLMSSSAEAAVASFYGLPLLLLHSGGLTESELRRRAGGFERLLDRAVHYLNSHPEPVEVSRPGQDIVEIDRLGGLEYSAVKSLLALAAFADYARGAYLDLYKAGMAFWSHDDRRVLATLQALKEAAHHTPTPNTYLTKQELSELERALKLENCHKEDLYKRICLAAAHAEQGVFQTSKAPDINIRVFVAHAGLSSNIVDVRSDPRHGVLLAYRKGINKKLAKASKHIIAELAESLWTSANLECESQSAPNPERGRVGGGEQTPPPSHPRAA